MKFSSCVKMLASLGMLIAVHALATPVEINSNQTNYIFRGDTTYFVDASVTLYGTTTFINGTVLKFNASGQLNIDSGGTVVCPASGIPATFTSYNDDSVGESISGSSGSPGIYDPNTDSGCDVNTFLYSPGTTLTRLCFCYANVPLAGTGIFSYSTATLQGCEFFNCGPVYLESPQVINNLFVNVNYLDWIPGGDSDVMQNNTYANCGGVALDGGMNPDATSVTVSDNLFDSTYVFDWTYNGSAGANNAFYNVPDGLDWTYGLPSDITLDSEPAYQAGPLGGYYLPSDSSLINAGDMSASDAGLGSFTTQTSQAPDGGTVDIGYHYPIWQYVVIYSDHTDYTFASGTTYFVDANVTLHGTTTFESGAILKYNSSGKINIDPAGMVVCPSDGAPAIFTSYNDNSIGAPISGSSGVPAAYNWVSAGTYDVNTFLSVTNVTLSNLSFSYASAPLGSPSVSYMTYVVSLQFCQFFDDGDLEVNTERVFNNLFVGTYVDWWANGNVYDPDADEGFPDYVNDNLLLNNTFVNSGMEIDNDQGEDQGEIWVFDNFFDGSDTADFSYHGAIGGDNAYYGAPDYLRFAGDGTLPSDPNFQTGPLGSYYLPSDSPLIDAGAVNVGDLGISYLIPSVGTTQTSQALDSGNIDIGFHYNVVP